MVNNTVTTAHDDRSGVARGDALHSGTDERSFSLDERHRLALHVRTHQRAVCVVVFKKRNQARGDGYELLRRNVDVVDFIAALQHEVAGLTAIDEVGCDAQFLVE